MQKEYEYTGRVMGTSFSIAMVSSDAKVAQEQANQAILELHAFETRFSRFLQDSELSQLNLRKTAVVSDIFFTAIELAQTLYVQTNGIFNPLVQIERFGYTKNFDDIQNQDTLENNNVTDPYDIDFSKTILDSQTKRVTLRPGQKVDFGGFLKGYAATKICTEIAQSHSAITGVIVNIGGDLHTIGVDENGTQFIFDIYNPITKRGIPVPVHNGSLATSGTYKRVWRDGQIDRHHILDATGTKNPVSDIISASVVAPNGAIAEAYTKVCINRELSQIQKIISNNHLQYLVILKDGTYTTNII